MGRNMAWRSIVQNRPPLTNPMNDITESATIKKSRGAYIRKCDLTEKYINRFKSYVNTSGGANACWPWTGAKNPQGYGNFRLRSRQLRSNRIAWVIANGDIPAGIWALHHCDNTCCCNPSHLFLGTSQDNHDDMMRKNRHAHGATHGTRTKPGALRSGDQHHWKLRPWLIKRGTESWSAKHPERMARGEDHGMRKLTEKQVLEIRHLYQLKSHSLLELSKMFHTSKGNVVFITQDKTWRHLIGKSSIPA